MLLKWPFEVALCCAIDSFQYTLKTVNAIWMYANWAGTKNLSLQGRDAFFSSMICTLWYSLPHSIRMSPKGMHAHTLKLTKTSTQAKPALWFYPGFNQVCRHSQRWVVHFILKESFDDSCTFITTSPQAWVKTCACWVRLPFSKRCSAGLLTPTVIICFPALHIVPCQCVHCITLFEITALLERTVYADVGLPGGRTWLVPFAECVSIWLFPSWLECARLTCEGLCGGAEDKNSNLDNIERVLVSFRVLRKRALQQIIIKLQQGLGVEPQSQPSPEDDS